MQVVPKKSGMTVAKNQQDEMIHIALEDQHKTTFTCPFSTFAYTKMPFGLYNAPSTFQRCMLNIFSDLLEDCMEVFMDDFTVGIEVDKAKFDVITSLPNPASVRDVHSFLRHDVDFIFDEACIEAFEELKTRVTSIPILQAPNWELPFELICDASNSVLEAVLGQRVRVGNPAHVIAYASRNMDPAQEFNLEIRDKKGAENIVVDHLSRIQGRVDPMPI
ncbi:Retrovirus-related Pol polyprotein, partial [Mucuna pruriens]